MLRTACFLEDCALSGAAMKARTGKYEPPNYISSSVGHAYRHFPAVQKSVLSKSSKDTLNLLAPIWTPYRLITLSYAVLRCVSATEFENDESTPSDHCRWYTQAHSRGCPQTFDRKAKSNTCQGYRSRSESIRYHQLKRH